MTKALDTCCVLFFFVFFPPPICIIVPLILSVTNCISRLSAFFFSLPLLSIPHSLPPLFSLSRSCKLQIRNIPPHMQWEVSANRQLTASRVGHYLAAQLGSHWESFCFPFGFLLSRCLIICWSMAADQSRVMYWPVDGTEIGRIEKNSNAIFETQLYSWICEIYLHSRFGKPGYMATKWRHWTGGLYKRFSLSEGQDPQANALKLCNFMIF